MRKLSVPERFAATFQIGHLRSTQIGFNVQHMATSFAEIIDLWPSIEEFASDVGVPFHTARNWRARGSIPAYRWAAIIDSGRRRKIKVTSEQLTRIAAQSEVA